MSHLALRTTTAGLLATLLLAACGSGSGGSNDTNTAHTPQMSELTDGSWVADSLTSPDHTLVQGSNIAMTFKANAVSVNAGCNTMNGDASISGSTLVVGTMASTMMACDTALMDQDHWLQQFLTSRPTITLQGTTLKLTQGSTAIPFAHKP
jgi:heat shock protein HslJ